MSLVLNTTPAQYTSANGDVLFTIYESTKATDPVTYPDYKYVADIYIGGVLVTRLKAVPNPVNKRGVFNIGFVVRNYLRSTFAIGLSILAQEKGSEDFYVDVIVKFGEEYDYTTYTDLLEDDERRYYNSYEIKQFTATPIVYTKAPGWATNRPLKNKVLLTETDFLVPYFALNDELEVEITTYTDSGSDTMQRHIP